MSASSTRKVPMSQKIAFGFGMLANQMFPAALGVFIIVLVQDLGFAALLLSGGLSPPPLLCPPGTGSKIQI